ncbi:hypothetical protein [Ureaplasma ceti]|uniref:Chromosome segregation protein SMC n=1 Tax=Ureaplasma ceti TaxID=3119530 RepID=A0ABP9UBN9_9BACT
MKQSTKKALLGTAVGLVTAGAVGPIVYFTVLASNQNKVIHTESEQNSTIEQLDNRIKLLKNNIDGLNGTKNNVQQQLVNSQNRINKLLNNTKQLEQLKKQLASGIEKQNINIQKLNNEIQKLEKDLADTKTKSAQEIHDLTNKLNNLKQKLANVTNKYNETKKADAAKIEGLNNQIAAQKAKIHQIKTNQIDTQIAQAQNANNLATAAAKNATAIAQESAQFNNAYSGANVQQWTKTKASYEKLIQKLTNELGPKLKNDNANHSGAKALAALKNIVAKINKVLSTYQGLAKDYKTAQTASASLSDKNTTLAKDYDQKAQLLKELKANLGTDKEAGIQSQLKTLNAKITKLSEPIQIQNQVAINAQKAIASANKLLAKQMSIIGDNQNSLMKNVNELINDQNNKNQKLYTQNRVDLANSEKSLDNSAAQTALNNATVSSKNADTANNEGSYATAQAKHSTDVVNNANKIAAAASSAAKAQNVTPTVQKLQSNIATAAQNVAKAAQTLSENQTKKAQALSSLANADKILSASQTKLANAYKEAIVQQNVLVNPNATKKQIDEARNELKTINAQIEKAQAQVVKNDAKVKAASADLSNIQKTIAQDKVNLSKAQQKLAAAQQALTNEETTNLQNSLADTKKKLASAQAEAKAQAVKNAQQIKSLNQNIDNTQKQLAANKTKYQTEEQKLNNTISNTKKALANANQTKANTLSNIANNQANIAQDVANNAQAVASAAQKAVPAATTQAQTYNNLLNQYKKELAQYSDAKNYNPTKVKAIKDALNQLVNGSSVDGKATPSPLAQLNNLESEKAQKLNDLNKDSTALHDLENKLAKAYVAKAAAEKALANAKTPEAKAQAEAQISAQNKLIKADEAQVKPTNDKVVQDQKVLDNLANQITKQIGKLSTLQNDLNQATNSYNSDQAKNNKETAGAKDDNAQAQTAINNAKIAKINSEVAAGNGALANGEAQTVVQNVAQNTTAQTTAQALSKQMKADVAQNPQDKTLNPLRQTVAKDADAVATQAANVNKLQAAKKALLNKIATVNQGLSTDQADLSNAEQAKADALKQAAQEEDKNGSISKVTQAALTKANQQIIADQNKVKAANKTIEALNKELTNGEATINKAKNGLLNAENQLNKDHDALNNAIDTKNQTAINKLNGEIAKNTAALKNQNAANAQLQKQYSTKEQTLNNQIQADKTALQNLTNKTQKQLQDLNKKIAQLTQEAKARNAEVNKQKQADNLTAANSCEQIINYLNNVLKPYLTKKASIANAQVNTYKTMATNAANQAKKLLNSDKTKSAEFNKLAKKVLEDLNSLTYTASNIEKAYQQQAADCSNNVQTAIPNLVKQLTKLATLYKNNSTLDQTLVKGENPKTEAQLTANKTEIANILKDLGIAGVTKTANNPFQPIISSIADENANALKSLDINVPLFITCEQELIDAESKVVHLLKTEVVANQQQSQELKNDVASIRKAQAATETAGANRLAQSIASNNATIKALQNQIKANTTTGDIVDSLINQAKKELANPNLEPKAEWQAWLHSLEGLKNGPAGKNASLADVNKQLTKVINDLTTENKQQAALQQAKQNLAKALDSNASNADIIKLQDAVKTAQNNLTTAQTTLHTDTTALDTVKDVRMQAGDTSEKTFSDNPMAANNKLINAQRVVINKLTSDVNNINNELNNANAQQKANAGKQAQTVKELNQEIKKLQEQLKNSQATSQTVKSLQNQVNTLTPQRDEAQKTNDNLKKTQAAIDKQLAANKKEVDQLTKTNQQLQTQNNNLTKQITKNKTALIPLKKAQEEVVKDSAEANYFSEVLAKLMDFSFVGSNPYIQYTSIIMNGNITGVDLLTPLLVGLNNGQKVSNSFGSFDKAGMIHRALEAFTFQGHRLTANNTPVKVKNAITGKVSMQVPQLAFNNGTSIPSLAQFIQAKDPNEPSYDLTTDALLYTTYGRRVSPIDYFLKMFNVLANQKGFDEENNFGGSWLSWWLLYYLAYSGVPFTLDEAKFFAQYANYKLIYSQQTETKNSCLVQQQNWINYWNYNPMTYYAYTQSSAVLSLSFTKKVTYEYEGQKNIIKLQPDIGNTKRIDPELTSNDTVGKSQYTVKSIIFKGLSNNAQQELFNTYLGTCVFDVNFNGILSQYNSNPENTTEPLPSVIDPITASLNTAFNKLDTNTHQTLIQVNPAWGNFVPYTSTWWNPPQDSTLVWRFGIMRW